MPFPEFVNGGVHDELEDERCEDAADHRRGNPLHDVGTRADGPHDRHEAHEHGGDGHELRPDPFDGAVDHRVLEIAIDAQPAFAASLVVGEIEIEEHEHTGFRVDAHAAR